MASGTLRLAVGLLVSAVSLCNAQQNRTLRICANVKTATLGGQITNTGHPEPTLLRMQTKALSEHKPGKAQHFVLEGVGLPQLGEPPSGIPNRSPYEKYGSQLSDADLKIAQENHCDYLLFSLVWDSAAAMGELPHTSLSPSYGGDLYPRSQVSITYRLHQLNPRAPVVEASVFTHDAGPPAGIMLRALDLVAAQVFGKIAKSIPPPVHAP